MTSHVRKRCLAAVRITLSINVCVLIAGVWCELFGPAIGVLLGIPGMLSIVAAAVVHRQCSRTAEADYAERPGATTLVERVGNAALYVAIPSFVIGSATMRLDGVPDGAASERPVFGARPVYQFNNHGRKTEVSRLRFVVAGSTFSVTWFGFSLYANGVCHNAIRRAGFEEVAA